MTKCKPTPQEAAEYLREFKDGGEMCCCCGYDIAIAETAVDALEKQIPKSPDEDYEETLNGEYFNGYKCPACKHHIGYGGAYCSWCGQALDWEAKE